MIDVIIVALLFIIIGLLVAKAKPTTNVKTVSSHSVILDSCALIDGRVVDLAKIGFLPKNIIVPQFIVKELQYLADGKDSYKRERARFGLQIVQQLQAEGSLQVEIDAEDPEKATTDEKLVALAKIRGAELFTSDYNLNQVATIEGVTVLNVNELAHALRPVALPGETVHVTILQSGTNRDQGVGYLDDGTMVVVDGAIKDIGKSIQVTINKSHQTVAGKMLFAKKLLDHPSTQTTKPTQSSVTAAPVKRNKRFRYANSRKSV